MEEQDPWRKHFGPLSEILVEELPEDFNKYKFVDAVYLDKQGWHQETRPWQRINLSEGELDTMSKQGRFLYHFISEKDGTQVYALYEKRDSKL